MSKRVPNIIAKVQWRAARAKAEASPSYAFSTETWNPPCWDEEPTNEQKDVAAKLKRKEEKQYQHKLRQSNKRKETKHHDNS